MSAIRPLNFIRKKNKYNKAIVIRRYSAELACKKVYSVIDTIIKHDNHDRKNKSLRGVSFEQCYRDIYNACCWCRVEDKLTFKENIHQYLIENVFYCSTETLIMIRDVMLYFLRLNLDISSWLDEFILKKKNTIPSLTELCIRNILKQDLIDCIPNMVLEDCKQRIKNVYDVHNGS
jgi:hypothetical protein